LDAVGLTCVKARRRRVPLSGPTNNPIMNAHAWFLRLACLTLTCATVCREAAGASATPVPTDAAAVARWQRMRFGMFIHWGPVSLKGTEIGWSRGDQVPVAEYDQLYHQFNPTKFNADDWVALAKATGMKYLVFTTKHHDGFCMWDTKLSDYKITKTPFGRDVVRELADACHRQGILFCTYYSILDWHHPDYPLGSPGGKTAKPGANMDRYNDYLKGQLAELVHHYGPLGILWFDGEWEAPWTHERGVDLYNYVRQLQPDIIVNNRVGKGREDMAGTTKEPAVNPGDYDTPEQQIGRFNTTRPWESCITICQQWAWKPDDKLKSLEECVHTLVTCAGGDGNLLLNVGPMPTGEIEPRQVARLKEIGAWLAKFGTTIYETRGGPFPPGPWGVSTCRGNQVFLHVLKWPDGALRLPALSRKVLASTLLVGGHAEATAVNGGLEIRVAPDDRQEIDTVIALELDGPAFGALPSGTTSASR
jgi:alpha-L-fucosidase